MLFTHEKVEEHVLPGPIYSNTPAPLSVVATENKVEA